MIDPSAPRPAATGGVRLVRGAGWGLLWVVGGFLLPLALSYALLVLAAHQGAADGSVSFRGTARVTDCGSYGRLFGQVQLCHAEVDLGGVTPADRRALRTDRLLAPHAVSARVAVEQHCGGTSRTAVRADCFLYDSAQVRDVGWTWVVALPVPVTLVAFLLIWFTRRSRRTAPRATARGFPAGQQPAPADEYDGGTTR